MNVLSPIATGTRSFIGTAYVLLHIIILGIIILCKSKRYRNKYCEKNGNHSTFPLIVVSCDVSIWARYTNATVVIVKPIK